MPVSHLIAGRNKGGTMPAGVIEARLFSASLSPLGWKFRGGRNRVVILTSGTGRITLGETEVPISAPSILWMPSGERGSLMLEAGSEGATLAIPELELGPALPGGAIFAEVRNAIAQPIVGAKIKAGDVRGFVTAVEAIEQELKDNSPGAQDVIRHHLALMLIAIWRLGNASGHRPRPSPRAIIRGFVHLMDLHARDHWTVGDYARTLSITSDRLNTAIRRATGRTPQDLIHDRIMTEAATLLDSSTLQIGEIASILGFKDAAYFSRFFKRLAGISPRAHRQGLPLKNPPRDTSFAAWP